MGYLCEITGDLVCDQELALCSHGSEGHRRISIRNDTMRLALVFLVWAGGHDVDHSHLT